LSENVITRSAPNRFGSLADQRCRKSSNDLDQIGLATGASFHKHAAEVGLDGGFCQAERHRDLRNAADLDDGKQHA
jgi:hypothetical protein